MKIPKQNLLFLGVFAGVLSFLSLDLFLILLVLIVIYACICFRYRTEDEKKFILSVFTLGIALRIVFVILYYYFFLLRGNMDILGPDGEGYQARGWYISRFLTGNSIYAIPGPEQIFFDYPSMVEYYSGQVPDWRLYQVGVFSYLIAFIYAIFGYVPLLIKFINVVLSVSTAMIVYELGKDLFGKTVGKVSMAIVAFLPSIFVFSLTSTRDPLVIFLLTASVYFLTRYYKTKNFMYFIFLLLSATSIYFIRIIIFKPFILVVVISLFLLLRIKLRWKFFLLLGLILVALLFGYKNKVLKYFDLAEITNPHIGYINTPGNNYKIFEDEYYSRTKDIRSISPSELSVAFLKGLLHSLFEPFPWKVRSKGEFIGLFQMLLWFAFFPFVILGFILSIRYKIKESYAALIYILVFCLLLAIGEGNVGTVFRHRDMLMPFFVIFGVAGVCNFLGKTELVN